MNRDDLAAVVLAHNTAAARVAASNIPAKLAGATFATYPGRAEYADRVAAWLAGPDPLGLVLQGPAGLGKSGLAAAAVSAWAARGEGSAALWNLLTEPHYRAEVSGGHLRRRPAPCWFERWPDLRDRLRRSWRGRDESQGAEEVLLDEFRERCALVALDDLDIDAISDWKESVVLRLLELPERGRRLVVTINAKPAEFAKRFGERCVDRMTDRSTFLWVTMAGPSLRGSA